MSNEKTELGANAKKVAAHLKARDALLWVVSPEEGRVEKALIEAAARVNYEARLWDCVSGVTDASGKPPTSGPGANATDPEALMGEIQRNVKQKSVWIFRDLPEPWLKSMTARRLLRNLAKSLPSQDPERSIIVLSPTAEIPPDLADHAILIKWELPDRGEIGRIFDQAISGLPDEKMTAAKLVRDQAIEAAVGLSAETAASCYANSIVTQKGKILPSVISDEKKRIVKGKGLEIFDPDPRGLDAVGGLELLKPWLKTRANAFSQRARDFGVPTPRGILLIGVPGCLHGDTPIHDPTDDTTKTVRQRHDEGKAFRVMAMREDGRTALAAAMPPQKFAPARMLRFTLANGEKITVTEKHRFKAADGSWVFAFEVFERLRKGERVLLASSSEPSR